MAFKFLSFLKHGVEQPLKLYDSIEKIPVMIFYHIMKTGEISQLNPLNQRVSEEKLKEIWTSLLEDYFQASNKEGYRILLEQTKRSELIRNKITTCYACLLLLRINDSTNKQTIVDTLRYFGFQDNLTEDDIKRRLSREASYLKLLDKSKELDKEVKKEEINFWKLVAMYEDSTQQQVNVDKMTLAHWIEKVKILREKTKNTPKNGRKR